MFDVVIPSEDLAHGTRLKPVRASNGGEVRPSGDGRRKSCLGQGSDRPRSARVHVVAGMQVIQRGGMS